MQPEVGMKWFPEYKPENQIEVQNPTAEDFRFEVAGLVDGQGASYIVNGHSQKTLPAYVANLYVEKMSAHILQTTGRTRSLNDYPERRLVVDNLIVNRDQLEPKDTTDDQATKEAVEQVEQPVTTEKAFPGAKGGK